VRSLSRKPRTQRAEAGVSPGRLYPGPTKRCASGRLAWNGHAGAMLNQEAPNAPWEAEHLSVSNSIEAKRDLDLP
jgi:hypothetical protein